MTNDEYSQLAAKAAGVTIGSNGRPAFTSYEQSMKYAEALTNLHKSGINKNSTPQEIAAASVGTNIKKDGTPNISSPSQGLNYSSALKNIKSNPQPNVNQNSNGTKPNNTKTTNNNTDPVYGPFKPDFLNSSTTVKDDKKDDKPQIVYSIPYCQNKVNITKGDVTLLKPDDESKLGYVEYNGKKYPIYYNEREEGTQAIFATYTEIKHVQLPQSGLRFDLNSAITNTSPEELPSRTLTTKNGNVLQSNSENIKFDNTLRNNLAPGFVTSYVALNAYNFVQNGLIRDNYDVVLMQSGSNNFVATVTFSQDYLGTNPAGGSERQSTPPTLLAVDKNGTLYNVRDYSN